MEKKTERANLRSRGSFESSQALHPPERMHQETTPLVLFVASLVDQRLVDVRDHASPGDRRLDQGVELFVAADGELEVARGDALDLEVLGGVACELEDLGGEVLCCWSGGGEKERVRVEVEVFFRKFDENEAGMPLCVCFSRNASLSLARARLSDSSSQRVPLARSNATSLFERGGGSKNAAALPLSREKWAGIQQCFFFARKS